MTTALTGTKRVVFVTSDLGRFTLLRASLISEVVRRRHKPVVMAPKALAKADVAALETLGATVVVTPFTASGFNPFAGYTVKRDLVGHVRAVGPHALAYCDAEAALAFHAVSKKAQVPRIVALLQHAPNEDAPSREDKALRHVFADLSAAVVDTPEDQRALRAADWLERPLTILVAPSAGIDIQLYPSVPLPPLADGFVFLLAVTGDDMKARETFAAAANLVGSKSTGARFVVADDREAADSGAGAVEAAHVVVHASAQPGLSSGLLHALAAGRPVITTDVAGCRDTVDERVNGCRVAPGDSRALADAMSSFLRRADLMPAMARASRLKAERRYDVNEVNRITLDALDLDDTFAVAA